MKNIILSIILIFPLLVYSQISKYYLPPKNIYKNATITLKDFSKYEAKQIYIKSDSIVFLNINTNLNENIALSKIDYIRVQEGNQALMWCGYGALLMGLISALNVMDVPNVQNPGAIILGFTISGAAIGGLIGLGIPKRKTYYLAY